MGGGAYRKSLLAAANLLQMAFRMIPPFRQFFAPLWRRDDATPAGRIGPSTANRFRLDSRGPTLGCERVAPPSIGVKHRI